MELFLRSAALVLLAAILGLLLKEQGKPFAPALSIAACCMALLVLGQLLQPVLELLEQLRQLAGLSRQTLGVILKAVGISLIAQLAELICLDAGQAALGKVIGLLGNGAILWLSLPLVRTVLEWMQEVLGKL